MENIFQAIHSFGSSIGCFINALLIYVVLTKSPKQIQGYGLLIINFAVTDFLICALNYMVMQRLISCGLAIIYISMGPCSAISPQLCFSLYVTKLHLYTHSIWLLLISFSYRYYVMIRSELSKLRIQLIIFLVYIPSLFSIVNIFISDGSETQSREIITKYHPEYNITDRAVTGNLSIFEFSVMYVIIHVVGLSVPMAIMILIMRKKIISKLGENASSERSKRLQIQLLKALTFQACIPILYAIGGSCYLVQQFNIINNAAPQYIMYCLFLLVPVLNPMSSFIFITPYRNFVISFLGRTYRKISITRSATQPDSSFNQHTNQTKY
ncbi:unnamed protein product [Caenorhabditis angaria]|uniref:G-protein coupled receptors family 1 profile domain-containing protein n=1 Tax=Caenorhabditis angaria TaxID=860376 RepID=A0A9P1IXY4_9PELO|nr:unnamed protein product [Caenorhabditis angaria]